MIFCTGVQGAEDWLRERSGVTTASVASDVLSMVGGLTDQQLKYVEAIASGVPERDALAAAGYQSKPKSPAIADALAGRPVGRPSDASLGHAARLAIERISGKPYGGNTGGYASKRGQEEEAFARMTYELRHQVIVQEVGLVKTDNGLFGASPDGLVNEEGMVEIKTPLNLLKVVQIIKTGDVSEYMHQMQMGMWVLERKWVDLVVFIPDLAHLNNGNEAWIKRIHRDETFIKNMVRGLWEHEARVREYESLFRQPFSKAAADAMALAGPAPA